MQEADHRADDEKGEGDEHAHAATANGEERAGGTASAHLHANPKHESADDNGGRDRRNRTNDRLAEEIARR